MLLSLFLGTAGHAQQISTVTIEVFPPETEVRAYLPGSPPQEGDRFANGSPFQVRDAISFPVRLSAPGYNNKEVDVALIRDKAVAPGKWEFKYELEPDGVVSLFRHEFRRYPQRSYGALAALVGGAGAFGYWATRRMRAEARASKQARLDAERQAAETKQRLDEVDPELAGRRIDSYEVLSLVGEGAFAKVYKARHVEYNDIFALKVLRPELLDPRVGERIEREMSIGRDLTHPYLVRAFGFGTFRDAPYLVMEFVEGRPLDERLEDGMLSLPETLGFLKKVAEGVQFAHDRAIVHRDLKPANLFLTRDGGVKILDFGVAKILDTERRLTLTGQALGTPHYMAPEQARGRAGFGSDIYALGAIAFEMVTGAVPFDGDTALEVMTSHTFSDVPSARALNPALPEALDELLMRMLAKTPEERPKSMAEVIAALDRITA